MPIICKYIPNRTKRPFTERDLARIAGYVNRDGVPWVGIIATVLITAGAGVLICKISDAISRTLGVLNIIKQIAAVLATAAALNAVIVWLSRIARVRIPVVTTVIARLLVLMLAIRALALGAGGLVSDLETIDDVSSTLAEWCDAVKDRLT